MSCRFAFGSRAIWAGVIGWVLALPTLAWAAILVPTTYRIVPKFEEIFVTAQLPVSRSTRFLLDVGGVGVAAAYALLALIPLGVLLGIRRPWCKVVAPLTCAVMTWGLNNFLFQALLTPLLPLLERVG